MNPLNFKLTTFTILFSTLFNPIFSQSYVDNKSSKIFILQGNTIVYDGYPKTLREAKVSKEFSSSLVILRGQKQ